MVFLGIAPDPEESLIGFTVRLAGRRRYLSVHEMAIEYGLKPLTNRPTRDALTKLAHLTDLPLEILLNLSLGLHGSPKVVYRGIPLPVSLRTLKGFGPRRVCPSCFADTPHHRAIWDISFVAACPVHSSLLVDACPSCSKQLTWNVADVARCGCGFDLTRAPSPTLPITEIEGTAVLYGLLDVPAFHDQAKQVASLPPFIDLKPGQIVDLLLRLGIERRGGDVPFSLEASSGREGHVFLKDGLHVARDWPHAFFHILDALLDRHSHRSNPKQATLKAVRKFTDTLSVTGQTSFNQFVLQWCRLR